MTMTSHSDKQRSATATAVDGRTARACDSCLRCRALWFCSADDAFLCQACDTAVHSANPLSLRHHRLRLNNSSPSPTAPAWHHGFNRKPRTPRPKPRLVPELDTSTDDNNEHESQLLYRVPIFDPVMDEFCSPPLDETKPAIQELGPKTPATATDRLVGLLPSEVELAEFSADMESLLGRGLDEDSFCMEELGLVGEYCHAESEKVKVEMADDDISVDNQMELELKFEYCSLPEMREVAEEASKRVSLRLDYEAVIAEWSTTHGSSPWTYGHRPEFDSSVYFMGMWGGGGAGVGMERDGGREARVTRYREKRRTRLFSKKIRYEVRKLNAEKRPRMKGRFVKRASLATAAPSAAFPY